MSEMAQKNARVLWANLLEAEQNFVRARREVVADDTLAELIGRALTVPSERGTALRLLQTIDVTGRMRHFAALVELASVGHVDIGLCREVIGSIPAYWVEPRLVAQIAPILETGGSQEYRRFAELLEAYSPVLLDDLVEKALHSDDADIREVGDDFRRL